jgi:hypothetical protein
MSANVSRMRAEIFCSPKPGSSISMVPMRANTKRKVAPSAGRKERSIRMVRRRAPCPSHG